jgi:hypothetical protein
LTPPARLSVDSATVSPLVRRSSNSIHLHVKITACGGRPVQGASVFATAVPYNQFGAIQAPTVTDGTVALTESRRAGFPASPHQRLLAVFVRASKPGEPATGGVSSSRVFAFRFARR